MTSVLQEVKLSSLTKAQCEIFGKTSLVDTDIELCAGLKMKKRKTKESSFVYNFSSIELLFNFAKVWKKL
jgi:hypothetical protein